MVRGHAGGSGKKFSFGEMAVSRCAVQFGEGPVGHGYVPGRDCRKAELVAAFDALLQDERRQAGLLEAFVAPLEAELVAREWTTAGPGQVVALDGELPSPPSLLNAGGLRHRADAGRSRHAGLPEPGDQPGRYGSDLALPLQLPPRGGSRGGVRDRRLGR